MERFISFFHNTSHKHTHIITHIIKSIIKFIHNKNKLSIILELINKPLKPYSKIKFSKKSIHFFRIISKILNIQIQHSCEIGEYKAITDKRLYYVDGYHNCLIHKCNGVKPCLYNNVVFEFQGNYFHGNKFIYKETDKCLGIPYKIIWKKDKIKLNNLEKSNYKVICIWETLYDILMKIFEKRLQ
jgi:hypothetical protein